MKITSYIPIMSVALATLTAPRHAAADWPAFGRGIVNAPSAQEHSAITTDGAAGAIITWEDHRNLRVNIFAQHVLASGVVDAGWPLTGRALLTDSIAAGIGAGGQFSPLIVSDGAGGAIVAWLDLRNDLTDIDIFAQHILSSGMVDPRWPANGTPLVSIAGNQQFMAMTSDGAGGAIVTWVDSRPGAESDIYAQHVLLSGVVDPRWPVNGLAVCSAAGPQGFPAIVADELGGALIMWHDDRPGSIGFDVYAQHVLNSGVTDPLWPANGRAVCTAPGDQGRGTITSDGAHGAIVAWTDGRIVNTFHIFTQHVLASGAVDPGWPLDGRLISGAGFIESRPLAVPDRAGGAIVTWEALDVHLNTFAQHVKSTGVVDPAWPATGKALSVTPRQQSGGEIVPDGAGGAIVAWEDSSDVFAQHVLASGVLDAAYPDTGRALCALPSAQGGVALVDAGPGGAIACWTDGRNGLDTDVFAIQVLQAGTTDAPPAPPVVAGVAFDSPRPNPSRNSTTLRYVLPRETRVSLVVYDVTGRRVRELAVGTRPAGEQTQVWDLRDDQGRGVDAGIYLARLDVEGRSLVQKLVTMQ